MASTKAPSEAKTHLEDLGAALERHGWMVRLTGEGSDSALKVVNQDAPELSETIRCVRAGDTYSFVWSWREAIGPADKLGAAARKIRHVLRTDGAATRDG